MIFVAVGFHDKPFDRLIKWIDEISHENSLGEHFFVQKGSSKLELKCCQSVDFLKTEICEDYIEKCKAVITHGGTGTTMTAILLGKRPIIVPRQEQYNEVCNDHQFDIARELEKRNMAYVATSKEQIVSCLKSIIHNSQSSSTYKSNNQKLMGLISQYLEEVSLANP